MMVFAFIRFRTSLKFPIKFNWMNVNRWYRSYENYISSFFLLFADAPTVRLLGSPQIDLEEGKDSLVLRCQADANPPANIVWRRAGRSEIASLQVSQSNEFLKLDIF